MPDWLLEVVAGLTLLVAALSAGQLAVARAWTQPAIVDADIALSQVLMGIALAGALVAGLRTLPNAVWAVVFAIMAAWFDWRLWQQSRDRGAAASIRGPYAPQLVYSAALLYLFIALPTPSSGGSGVSGMAAAARVLQRHLLCRWLLPALPGIEFGEIVKVLRAVLIAGVEPALLLGGQATDPAAADRAGGESGGRIVEVPAVHVRLAPMTVRAEAHRVDVDPAGAWCLQFYPDRQPVRFCRVAQLAQDLQAALQVLRIDGQVKIAMLAGLPPGQRGYSPAAAHPVADPGTIQPVQDFDHVTGAHASS